MRIKHIETNIEKSVEFGKWIREYVRTDLYKNWEILNLDNVVKVITLFKDGKVSTTLMSRTEAENHKKNAYGVDVNISRERVTMEFYEKYLKEKILSNQSSSNKLYQNHFLNKIRYVIFEKIRPKTILKPIWNASVIIILGGLGTLLGYILIEYYKNEFTPNENTTPLVNKDTISKEDKKREYDKVLTNDSLFSKKDTLSKKKND